MKIDKQTILEFDKPGPRYTSYPTAPEWSNEIDHAMYTRKLSELGQSEKTLSLYIHIPFCESLCYFCGCTTNIRKNVEKVGNEYVDYLFKEIDLIKQSLGSKKKIRQLHWGGGTPSFMTEKQMERLFLKLRGGFDIDFQGEVAIEADPRRITKSKVQTLRDLGFNRISIGVQDFDDEVQKYLNRIQPFDKVKEFYSWCRELKFESVNFDLIYGLPVQTTASFAKTINQVIHLKPDRIALYSFAYIPWLRKHQEKLDKHRLPTTDQKLDIFLNSREQLIQNGYESIAMDHFALKDDELTRAFHQGKLYRNFMGYTVKPADEYIGFGATAIGFLGQAYFQNHKTLPAYYDSLKRKEFPVERGKILSRDDIIRQWIINAFMCQFRADKECFRQKFQCDFDAYFSEEEGHIQHCVHDGLLSLNGNVLEVTDFGKIFIRNVCMGFDWYLRQKDGHRRFSKTI